MKAILCDQLGGLDVMRLAEIPIPSPGPGEVLIRVHAAGVNPVDWKIMEGGLARLFPCKFPLIPGWDAAGTVAALGDGVTSLSLGERVWSFCRKPDIQWGTYAEYVVMSADGVAPMPANLTFAQASTFPLAALTAWQSLLEVAQLRAGQRVLIHAGAGGVGGFAVPLAKWAGATVIATAKAGNHDYVRDLGADHVIDYATDDFTAATRALAPEGVDMAFGTVGGEVLARSYETVRPGGILVSITDKTDKDRAEGLGIRCKYVFVKPDAGHLRRLSALTEQGVLRVPEIVEMPLARAAEALALSRTGHVRGKIVLNVG
ncbi:Bifunctional protein: zinc-containing alcohol dehydrogenase quinone oxidoreductase (NADPH:quinone reductase) [Paramagnetospirillum magnetotacticum MS-1]|uniref:Bifunctional protein: zinc-containing alcohol dehydrogenase quinone oxidoreductase (NADPH:quinone reductase) n=1 Tax=Paramagnetospirillum magnetotacticum MS-1 TaxID=272627 RepID=A0A0C2YYP6_PARME|nr:NADP-dependent oxidoreductase [Paramagnetospirillum magnetotacticum]KIM00209.1 Bifunctional protein: zinc-containing alcohol dehydrogenase quinone oxidoreductase (NADPH:quinone reductase) [Paramagnetospirillum magnetotacticum MS-1]